MRIKKRIAALLMVGAMVCSTLPVNVLAVESSDQNVGGLCEHHTEHNADCGYTEGIEGTPCNHEHTEDCYTLVTSCVHKHTADCYPAESVSDNTASPSDVENQEPVNCTHECSEDTGCIKKELDCKHEHDEACGYSPATEGTPCTYECEACSGQEQINALPNVEDSPRENAEEIAALLAVAADPANKPTEGDGTEQSPYQITNAEELKWFRDTVNSGTTDIHARLLHDIDLKNVSWEPIGTQKKPYNGTFDGNAYTIKNFRLGDHTKPDPISEKGLFGWIGSGGTIQDLVVKVESIGSATNPNNFNITKCGLIAAYNAGTIRRCSVMVNYTLYVAGEIGVIAYQNSGIIENCLSAVGTGTGAPKFPGRIPDDASAAGIAYENSGTIKNCLFGGKLRTDGGTGNSYTAKDYAIASPGGTLTNCYYYHSKPRVGDAIYEGELYKDGDKSTVISKTQKEMASGEVTWRLNEEGKNGIWRQKAIGSADISLDKSYGRVKQNTDGSYYIVTPHIHRLDNGTQTEFKEIRSLDEITRDTSDTKYYCLSENVVLSTVWAAPNRDISLCLNGKNITAPAGASAITVGTGSTFTLMDCKETGKISSGSSGIAVIGGTFNLHSGVISGNTTGVLLNGGRCTLNGGSITKNTTGVDYLNGTLTLSGGAKVIENQGGEENKTKNILLHTGKTLSFGKLNDAARFGISVGNSDSSEAPIPVTDETGGKYFNNLFPDDVLTNELYQEGDVVWLRTQRHKAHCVCGGTHTDIGNHAQEKKLNFQPWNPYAKDPAKPQMPTSMPAGVDGYYLTQDVTLNSTWSPSNVVLCLNGHKMTFSGNGFVEISGNGKLTLTDCGTTGKLCREGNEVYKKGGISLSTGSTFDMYGGTITGFQHGVSTDQVGGTIHLYGGTITGNETVHGAGVFCWGSSSNPSTFIMYGGKITNNHATYSGSDINVKPSGGGVFLREYSKFEMYGGEITGNTATYGGGVYCGAIISPNTAEMILHGGKITGNTATYGGGVYFKDKAFQVTGKGKVTITDNTGNGGKNVVLFDGKTIQVMEKLHEETRIGVTSFHGPTDGKSIPIAKTENKDWIKEGNFTSDIPDYGIALSEDGKIVQLQTHQHSWEYIVSQDGTTITEHCKAENCGLPKGNGGSVAIKAPTGNLIYDGQGKAAVLENTLISDVDVSDITYTKDGTAITGTPTDAGTYTAAVTVGGEKATVQYTIAQSGTEFSGGVKVSAYVYGDPIFVTVTPKATGKAPIRKVRALSTPQAGEMAIYEGDRQLTEAQTVTSGKELTFTIDTAKAKLGKGWHTLTAKFVGSQNMAAQAETKQVYIRQAAIASADVAVEGKSFTYKGSPITPAVSVTLKNTQLIEGTDYTLAYTNHTNAGTATVTVTGIGNYIGTAKRTFVINKAAAPEISWPTASAITCGEKVSDSSLNGGSTQYGTFAWSDAVKDTIPPVGTSPYKVVFTPSEATKNNYETITTTEQDVSLTVINAKSLNGASVTVSGSYTYTGQAQIPAADAVTVQLNGKTIPNDQYTIAARNNTNAGQAIVTVTGIGDYTGTASGTFTIGKATPNPITPTELNAFYGSTLKDVSLPKGWAWDIPGTSVGNVGKHTFAATYIEDNSGNYNPVQQNLTVKVSPASYKITLTGQADSPTQITLNKAVVEPGNIGAAVSYGMNTTNTAPSKWQAEKVFSGLTADTTYYFFAKVGATTNYAETISTGVAITTPEKEVSSISIQTQPAKLAYTSGQPLDLNGLSVQVSYSDNTSKTIGWDDNKLTADPAQGTVLTVTEHSGKTVTISYGGKSAATDALTVTQGTQAALSITGKPTTVYNGDTFTLTTTGGSGTGTVTWEIISGPATVDANGKVTVTGIGEIQIKAIKAADTEYAQSETTIALTAVKKPSSGGGSSSGGGGGSSSSGGGSGKTDTTTTTKPDGTKVQTETKKDGTKIQTETKKDGSVTKTTTNPNGSSVTETKAADGSTGTVKTDKNGNTEAETKVSTKAVEDAKKSGEAVKAPVEVKASRDSSTAPTVKVELPKNSGDTKVEIPVSNVKPGTVAVIVHADGTEEIVKNSLPTEDGIQLTINGGATVKIVDNSKGFIDTQDHWAKDAIDFVSARGLVSGMSATIYAPDASATRAQLWTILARQNDADLTGGSIWYEKAQNWAKEKGISDGTNPNSTINRAQMVTMLWRAMGQPAAASGASFADVPTDSYYAQAVAWAIENGITAGVGGGRFDPNSTCTRGQIATFLHRSYLSK